MTMPAGPSGTVTFLFTDAVGSTALWESRPGDIRAALSLHDAVVRSVVAHREGYVFSTAGDSFAVAFSRPVDAALDDSSSARSGRLGWDAFQLDSSGESRRFPPLRSIGYAGANLPIQASRFFGRGEEISEIIKRFGDDERLVTLVGAGGIGKTRLALQASAELAGQLVDGVWFVPLAVTLIDHLLSACAGVTVLATSRQALRLEGERVLIIGPLEHSSASRITSGGNRKPANVEPKQQANESALHRAAPPRPRQKPANRPFDGAGYQVPPVARPGSADRHAPR